MFLPKLTVTHCPATGMYLNLCFTGHGVYISAIQTGCYLKRDVQTVAPKCDLLLKLSRYVYRVVESYKEHLSAVLKYSFEVLYLSISILMLLYTVYII